MNPTNINNKNNIVCVICAEIIKRLYPLIDNKPNINIVVIPYAVTLYADKNTKKITNKNKPTKYHSPPKNACADPNCPNVSASTILSIYYKPHHCEKIQYRKRHTN